MFLDPEDCPIPDFIRAITSDQNVKTRSLYAILPWQHMFYQKNRILKQTYNKILFC